MSTTTSKRGDSPLAPATPAWNALFLLAALAGAGWLLVARGRMSWPPSELLASVYTVAGCLALVGPVLLARRDPAGSGLGDLLWMTAGLLGWVYNAAALLRGDVLSHNWATPLPSATLGLTVLAVLLAGWRLQAASARNWTWTNVVGWILGLYWVGMGLYALLPASPRVLAMR